MKRLLYALSAMFLICLPLSLSAQVAINETNFPDAAFRQYVSTNLDEDGDGSLSVTEIENIKSVSVNSGMWVDDHYQQISDLTGIGFLTAITSLECSNNNISSLDISENTALEQLRCGDNPLNTLDLSKNTLLTYLYCSNTQISSLNLEACTQLESLYCSDTKLTSLDLSKNEALTTLNCSNTYLTELDMSHNVQLRDLDCGIYSRGDGTITRLDVSRCVDLTSLRCYRNLLTSLDISNNTALTNLDCGENRLLESLDVTKNIALQSLSCHSLPITELDVSNNTELNFLNCDNTKLTSLDISHNTKLTTLNCGNWEMSESLDTLDISQNTELTYLNCHSIKASTINTSFNTKLQTFYCQSSQFVGLDLSENRELNTLNCSDCPITGLDLRVNINLNFLDCSYTRIKSLDLSNNTELNYLRCDGDSMPVLDVSKNTLLQTLECQNCLFIRELDFSKNTALVSLRCDYTSVSELDLKENTQLTLLNCQRTPIKKLDIGMLERLEQLDCSQTEISALDVTHNSALRGLNCANTPIRKLDVTRNPQLMNLSCANTLVRRLDLTHNPDLQVFVGNGSKIKMLDVSHCPQLRIWQGDAMRQWSLDLKQNPAVQEDRVDYYDIANYGYWYNQYACTGNLYEIRHERGVKYPLYKLPGLEPDSIDEGTLSGGHFEDGRLVFDQSDVRYTYRTGGYTQKEQWMENENWQDGDPEDNRSILVKVQEPIMAVFTIRANPDAELDIDEINFPDSIFREYVRRFDTNNTETLSTDEIRGIKEVDVAGTAAEPSALANLEGIEYFVYLEELDCSHTAVTGLNLVTNTALKRLRCDSTAISTLNLDANTRLLGLSVAGTRLTSLNLNKNTLLMELSVRNTNIPLANLVINTDYLILLDYGYTLLTMDITKYPNLRVLRCDSTPLQNIDVTGHTALRELNVSNTGIRVLDVSKNTFLQTVLCDNTQLTSLDVHTNRYIRTISCDNCGREVGLTEGSAFNLKRLPGFAPALASDFVGGTLERDSMLIITATEVTYSYALTYANSAPETDPEPVPTEPDGSNDSGQTDPGQTEQEDPDRPDEGQGSEQEEPEIPLPDTPEPEPEAPDAGQPEDNEEDSGGIPQQESKSSKAVTRPGTLTFKLTVSSTLPYEGEVVAPTFTPDTGSWVEKGSYVTLSCITEGAVIYYGVGKDAEPTRLYAEPGVVVEDVDTMFIVTEARYTRNNAVFRSETVCGAFYVWETIDVDKPVFNPVSGSSVERGSYVQITAPMENSVIYYGLGKDAEPTVLYSDPGVRITEDTMYISAVAVFEKRGKAYYSDTVYACYDDVMEPVVTDPISEDVPIDPVHFPDPVFRAYVKMNFDADGNDTLNVSESAPVSLIGFAGNSDSIADVADLTGIEYFPNLQTLYCYYTRISRLDLRHNPELSWLNCSNTPLEALEINQNPKVEWINCSYTLLTRLEVGNCRALNDLNCAYTLLSELNIRHNPLLERLYCNNTDITDLDVHGNILMERLYCSNTAIKHLDIGGLPALQHLYCGNTHITSLDLSGNPALQQLYCYNNSLRVEVDENLGFNLDSLPFFDVARMSDVEGGYVQNNRLTFTGYVVTYTYQTKADSMSSLPDKLTFMLKRPMSTPENPVFTPDSGSLLEVGDRVSILCPTDRSEIYYGLGVGAQPTQKYFHPLAITDTTYITAVAKVFDEDTVYCSDTVYAVYYVNIVTPSDTTEREEDTLAIGKLERSGELCVCRPNPFGNEFWVEAACGGLLRVYAVSGKQMADVRFADAGRQVVPAANWPAGVYVLRFETPDNRSFCCKLVKR